MQGALGTGAGASAYSVPNASLPTAKCQVMSALWVIGRHAEGDGRFKWLQIMRVSAHYLFTCPWTHNKLEQITQARL